MDIHECPAKGLLCGRRRAGPARPRGLRPDQAVYAATELGSWQSKVKALVP